MTNRSQANGLSWLVALCVVLASACGDGSAEPRDQGIARETFIATYVDLRRAALEGDEGPITAEERARVLERHGVTSQDLLEFVEIHGRDLAYMETVWDTVETILGQVPPEDSLPEAEDLPLADSLP